MHPNTGWGPEGYDDEISEFDAAVLAEYEKIINDFPDDKEHLMMVLLVEIENGEIDVRSVDAPKGEDFTQLNVTLFMGDVAASIYECADELAERRVRAKRG